MDVVLVVHQFVDGTVGGQFDDAVGHGVDKLVVVAGEEDVAAIELEVVVEGLDALHVQVVGGGIEDQAVGAGKLHTGYHAAHLLATGEDGHFLQDILVLEEHTAQEGFEIDLVAFTVLAEPVEHVEVGVEEGGIVQRQIGRGDGDAPFVRSGGGLGVAVDNLEEGGHGAGIVTDEDNLLALLHVEVEVVEEHGTIFGDGLEVADFQDLVAGLALHLEDDAGVFTRRGFDLLHVEFLKHLLSAGGLLALGHVGGEAADKLFQFLTLLLGFLTLVLGLAQGELRRLVPEGVVAGEEGHLAKVDIDGVGAHLIEEVAVVADHEHGMFEVAQIFFKPLYGFQVEVVGGLVEQQVVGLAEEGLRQHDAHLLLTGEFAHELAVQVFLDTQTAEQRGGIVFGGVATERGKLILQFGHLNAVLVGEVGLAVEGGAFLHHAPHHGVSHEHGVEHGLVVILEVVLTEDGEALAGPHLYLALRGVQFAGDGTEQGRFAGTVGTDDAVDVTTGELQVDVLIENALAKLDGEIGNCNHIVLNAFVLFCPARHTPS